MTLDADVERMLRSTVRERGISFKEALNEAIRLRLTAGSQRRKRRFVQKSCSLGSEQTFRWDKPLAVSEALEDEEISRKLAQSK